MNLSKEQKMLIRFFAISDSIKKTQAWIAPGLRF